MPPKVNGAPGSARTADPTPVGRGGVPATFLDVIDGRGPDGRVSHSKLAAFWSWVFGLGWFSYFALHHGSDTLLLGWGSLTFVAPYGIKGLTAWLAK